MTLKHYGCKVLNDSHLNILQASSDQGAPAVSLPDVAAGAGIGIGGPIPMQLGSNTSSSTSGLAPALLEWIETRSKKAALKLEKLDTDLKNYKSNSIKESIRRGHDDLGDHFLDCGDLSNALKYVELLSNIYICITYTYITFTISF